jgi:hypothetical protein
MVRQPPGIQARAGSMTPGLHREPPFRPQLARPALPTLARRINDELIEAAAAARERLAAIENCDELTDAAEPAPEACAA